MIDIASDTWATVKKLCEQSIATNIEIVIRPGEHHTYQDAARGEIVAFRRILALAEPPLQQPAGDYSQRKDRSGI